MLVIDDPRAAVWEKIGFAAFCFVLGTLCLLPRLDAPGTPALVFGAMFTCMGLVALFFPLRRVEFDRHHRHVLVRNWWLWGYGRPRAVDFRDIAGADVLAPRGETLRHFPRLILTSGRKVQLSFFGGSAADAEGVAQAALREVRDQADD